MIAALPAAITDGAIVPRGALRPRRSLLSTVLACAIIAGALATVPTPAAPRVPPRGNLLATPESRSPYMFLAAPGLIRNLM